jgi:hypothetical protein
LSKNGPGIIAQLSRILSIGTRENMNVIQVDPGHTSFFSSPPGKTGIEAFSPLFGSTPAMG